ncbi:Transient receptor potential channel, partial [Operophtera brumata]
TSQVTTEHRYHDHNNLSVKNRDTKKTEYKYNKKNYVDRSADELRDFVNMTEDIHSMSVIYERARPSDYPDDFRLVRMDFKYMSDDVLQIKVRY